MSVTNVSLRPRSFRPGSSHLTTQVSTRSSAPTLNQPIFTTIETYAKPCYY